MEAYFKRGRRIVRSTAVFFSVLAVFLGTVFVFVGIFWWYGRSYAGISLEKTYYFLVRDCEDATAGAVSGQVYLAGGAGYLYEEAGECAVILSCYFTEEDAERVRASMAERRIETRVLALETRDFSLYGAAAKEKKAVVDNAETVETCARMLYVCANGLERTETSQEEARSAVRGVETSLSGLSRGNEDGLFDRWDLFLEESARRAAELSEGIVFAKDLRYLQVRLLLAVVHADEYFL